MKEIKRDAYLNEIIRKKNNGLVKVITGIRRCVKSYLLFTMYFNYLIQNGVDKNHIILFSFDNDEDIDKLDIYYPEEPTRIYDRTKKNYTINAKKFRAYIREITNEHDMFYIFLDEVQLLDNFVGTLNGFIRHVNFDTYVTGSNSRMLSKDVITEFRGRGDPIRIHPLSFKEFFDAVNKEFDEAYNEYSFYGGMPYIVHLLTEQDKSNYLKLLFEEVYKKDIVDRYSIVDANSFDSLVKILASSIGSYTNPSKLERTYKSNSISYSHNTIKKHIEYLMDSFLIDEVTKYDVKGKRYIGTSLKYYFKDIGLRNALLNFRQQEPTHIMENIIYNELIIRGYNVDVGMVEINERMEDKYVRKQLEVDFICTKGNEKLYIQSAYSMPDYEKTKQEKKSLIHIEDSFRKIIIVKDTIKRWMTEEGILVIGLKDFLLGDLI